MTAPLLRPNYEGLAAELKARGADHVMTEDELQRTGLGHILQVRIYTRIHLTGKTN